MTNYYLIACKIERGGFSTERTFEIPLSDTVEYSEQRDGILVGTAHADHLRDNKRKPLAEDTPGYGENLRGFVRCRKIRDLRNKWVVVEVPSADWIHLSSEALVPDCS